MRLERRLKSDPGFPVAVIGDQGREWEFDVDDVFRHLGCEPPTIDDVSESPAIDKAQLRDVVAPPLPKHEAHTPVPRRSAHHAGEATARQRKDEADASLKEDKLREQRAELVERGELRQALAAVMVSFAHDLDALPDQLVERSGFDRSLAEVLRPLIDAARTNLVRNAEAALAVRTS